MSNKITALFKAKKIDENSYVTHKDFWREGASLRDEMDRLHRSQATMGERLEELRKENASLKQFLTDVAKRFLD